MNNKMKFSVIGFCVLGMTSCAMMDDSTGRALNYPAYTSYENSPLSMQNNLNANNYYYKEQARQEVVVPNSYHMGSLRSPVTFQDRDQTWVSSQSPQAYTIELAEGDKPAQVAQVLYKAPKANRRAQVKYQRDGKDYYRGVYGSYSSAAEAQKALDALPEDMKKGASVKSWGSVGQ